MYSTAIIRSLRLKNCRVRKLSLRPSSAISIHSQKILHKCYADHNPEGYM